MSKKKMINLKDLPDASYELLRMTEAEDTVCVIVGAAFLDNLISGLLLDTLGNSKVAEKLLSSHGGLENYSSKVDLAFCLDIVNKDRYNDLLTIGKIRNYFAHNFFGLSFSAPEIQSWCNCLKEWQNIIGDDVYKDPPGLSPTELGKRIKTKFINTVMYLSVGILKDAGLTSDASN